MAAEMQGSKLARPMCYVLNLLTLNCNDKNLNFKFWLTSMA
jgi:hypothetical protein